MRQVEVARTIVFDKDGRAMRIETVVNTPPAT